MYRRRPRFGRATYSSTDKSTGARKLLEVDLWEISIVTFPMLTQARVSKVKTAPVSIDDLIGKLARLNYSRAAQAFEAKLSRLSLERRYAPDQPRAPAGSSEGGRWTSGGGGVASGDPTAMNADQSIASDAFDNGVANAAQNEDQGRYSVDLQKEEGYGHTLRDHVGKTGTELLAEIEKQRLRIGTPFVGVVKFRPAEGSFDSRESANDFVNRTLEYRKDLVDAVATGKLDEAVLDRMFGYPTGKEAYLKFGTSKSIIQATYGVRVVIHMDASSARGYRVRTAFPFNLH